MNKICNGHYFIANKIYFYRCFMDGKILERKRPKKTKEDICSNCNRQIVPSILGKLKVKTEAKKFVVFPNGWEIELPIDQLKLNGEK